MVDLAVSAPIGRTSPWTAALERGGPRLWLGGAVVALLLLVALLAPLLAPHDPVEQDLLAAQMPPAWMHGGEASFPLGTDSLGHCVLSRLIYSSRIAVSVAFIAASLAAASRTSHRPTTVRSACRRSVVSR